MLVTTLGYDSYQGRIAIGRIVLIGTAGPTMWLFWDATDQSAAQRSRTSTPFRHLQRASVPLVDAGDIVALTGIEDGIHRRDRGRGRTTGGTAHHRNRGADRLPRCPAAAAPTSTNEANGNAALLYIRVLVLTTFKDDEYVFEALRSGASGFLLKDAPPEDLLAAIRAVARGGVVLDPAVTSSVVAGSAGSRRPVGLRSRVQELTERELVTLRLLGLGPVQRRDRRTPGHQRSHRQDTRGTRPCQAARPRPRPGGRPGLREPPGGPPGH